ncbi:MAG: hypothetical protein L6Q77_02555 [Bacteroidetes bacterium]|nr:hypothetical protein [Bacteroidota bacterium]
MFVIIGLVFSIALFLVWMLTRYDRKAKSHIKQTKRELLNRRRKRME